MKTIYDDKSWFSKATESHANLPITLIPKVSATLILSATSMEDVWQAVAAETPYEIAWQGRGGGSLFFSEYVPYLGNWRVTGARMNFPDPGCAYCTNNGGVGINEHQRDTWEDEPNSHRIHVRGACHGDLCHIQWWFKFDQLVTLPVTHSAIVSKTAIFGEPVYFDLPSGSTDWKIDGTFYNGKQFSHVKGLKDNYVLELQSSKIGSDQYRIVLQLTDPFRSRM